MLKDVNKYFNNDDNYHTNQQLIGYKDLFRGFIAKDWVIDNYNSANLYLHNDDFIENYVKHCYECWKRRQVVAQSRYAEKGVKRRCVDINRRINKK